MIRLKFVLFLIIAALITACKKDDGGVSNPGAETIEHDGETREYILHIPDTYDGSTAVPIMFNFHGFGGTATAHMEWADMRGLADQENFILVYPQGTLLDGSPHWNAGLPGPNNKSDADDFGFIQALITELGNSYNIDLERVYACGYSNGAFFSFALACYHSNLIAGVGSVSGSMLEETWQNCNPSHPTPVIVLHGTSDATVPYQGGEGLASIDQVLDYWNDFNNTDSAPETTTLTDNDREIQRLQYINGDNSISVALYRVVGGEHVWFDMRFEGKGTNELIWDFVSQYDINGLR